MVNNLKKTLAEQAFLEELRKAQDSIQDTSTKKKKIGIKKIEKENDEKLIQLIRREMLARPLCRKLIPWPNPELEGPFEISPNALRAKMTSRLEYLAQPRKENSMFREMYYPKKKKKASKKGKKEYIISDRLLELSRPKPMSLYTEKISTFKKRRTIMNQQQLLAYRKNIERLSAPRRTPLSRVSESVEKKKPLSQFFPRLNELSQPSRRPPNNNEMTYEEAFTVKKSALKYKASERIIKLAKPKKLSEEALKNLNYNPKKRFLNSLKYKATARMIELAKPIIRQTTRNEDIKEDPFKVNPRALKARCSKRIKELAKPRKRNNV